MKLNELVRLRKDCDWDVDVDEVDVRGGKKGLAGVTKKMVVGGTRGGAVHVGALNVHHLGHSSSHLTQRNTYFPYQGHLPSDDHPR